MTPSCSKDQNLQTICGSSSDTVTRQLSICRVYQDWSHSFSGPQIVPHYFTIVLTLVLIIYIQNYCVIGSRLVFVTESVFFFSVYFTTVMYSCWTVSPWKGQYSLLYAADTNKAHCLDVQYIVTCRDQSPSYSVPTSSVYKV